MKFEEALARVKADCGSAMGLNKWSRFIIHVSSGELVWGSRLHLIDRDALEMKPLTSADLTRDDWEFEPSYTPNTEQ